MISKSTIDAFDSLADRPGEIGGTRDGTPRGGLRGDKSAEPGPPLGPPGPRYRGEPWPGLPTRIQSGPRRKAGPPTGPRPGTLHASRQRPALVPARVRTDGRVPLLER